MGLSSELPPQPELEDLQGILTTIDSGRKMIKLVEFIIPLKEGFKHKTCAFITSPAKTERSPVDTQLACGLT